jgi:hypothetical protein
MANVDDPTRYRGNTISILGCGDVKVKIHDPIIVKITDISSK